MKNKYEFKLNPDEVNDSHMGLARRIKRGERILELGCSSGYLSRFLKQDLGCFVIGVDIDQHALADAAVFCDKAIVADLDQATWLKQLAGITFDTILCADVLEHLKNPVSLLASLKPYLNKQGRILASIPNVAHASIRLELLQGHFDYESLGLLDETHLHFYTLDGCVSMLMQAGYLCQDVAYSIHDLADEVIDESLRNAGLTVSPQFRKLLHQPEATAFQFIIEAIPVAQELLRHKPPALIPKPLVSSGAFYSLKQEHIEELERQITALELKLEVISNEKAAALVHNQNHLKNIKALEERVLAREKECEAEKTHNSNHQKSIRAFEQRVAALERERDAEKIHSKNHLLNIKELEKQTTALRYERDAEKIHNKNHQQNVNEFEKRVAALERERDAERTHNQNHQKNIQELEKKSAALELQVEAERVHNQNHLKNIHAFEEKVQALEEQLAAEKVHNQNHVKNVHAFEEKVQALEDQLAAEQVHNQNHLKNIHAFEESVKALESSLAAADIHNQNHVKNIQAFEERVQALALEVQAEKVHNQNHLKNIASYKDTVAELELELNAEKTHNLNHQQNIDAWIKTARILDEGLFDFTLRLEAIEGDKQQLTTQIEHIQAHHAHAHAQKDQHIANLLGEINNLQAAVAHLEGVLQRVHSKASYRTVRFIKDAPQKLVGALKGRERHALAEGFVLENNEHQPIPVNDAYNVHDYSAWLVRYGDISPKLPEYQADCLAWNKPPKIAVVMPVYNPTQSCLEEAIASVVAQVYPHWELCIADDASTATYVQEVLQRYAQQDKRIKVMRRSKNGHISRASNSALELVSADFVALMDHDDVLTEDALYWVAKTIREHPDVQLIYSDEDKLTDQGQRYGAYFKPDWNPELLMSHNFICHLGVYRTARVRKLGGFNPEFDGAQDYDLALRYVVSLKDNEIKHIPRILYHWRATPGSTANGIHEKPYAEPLILKAVEQALLAKGVAGEVIPHAILPGALRVRYALPKSLPLVSIIIPTRNGFSLLKRCIDSILHNTDYSNFEIIIMDNGSDDWIAQRYLQYLTADERIKVIRDESPFNYAALNNKAAALARGELIALLNNDLEAINSDWLSEMVSIAVHPEVGAVGAKLYYPNDTLQHAGVIVGLGGVAGHSHKHFPRDNAGYCGRLLMAQNLSAVTAACLVVRKNVFMQVKGFDADHLKVAFNDVDLCLRIQDAGYWNVWTPYAELYHYESATRGYEDTPEKQARFTSEVEYMKHRWGESLLQDPAYNPNLTLDREDFSFSFPPRI